jgi:hypothetical protein
LPVSFEQQDEQVMATCMTLGASRQLAAWRVLLLLMTKEQLLEGAPRLRAWYQRQVHEQGEMTLLASVVRRAGP